MEATLQQALAPCLKPAAFRIFFSAITPVSSDGSDPCVHLHTMQVSGREAGHE
ncbi:hypothetical protein CY34DRAFT_744485 [Suillus luteus UH-Slu-Lm8-n1]|uniref:Uncharacterized protein n=1 Tax=Suillus luteus UH-Slu-Lm8-n1 TaxID=930992 RepID=A0A0C9ZZ53_9AGAM|nr:hypothetical protein CY34DRAFT_744485 [Suillus luteus UH-Slu-Lm8-n1]